MLAISDHVFGTFMIIVGVAGIGIALRLFRGAQTMSRNLDGEPLSTRSAAFLARYAILGIFSTIDSRRDVKIVSYVIATVSVLAIVTGLVDVT